MPWRKTAVDVEDGGEDEVEDGGEDEDGNVVFTAVYKSYDRSDEDRERRGQGARGQPSGKLDKQREISVMGGTHVIQKNNFQK